MKKNEMKTGKTLAEILAEANTKADLYNAEKGAAERVALEVAIDKLVKDYNELSLLTAYNAAKAQELPIIALAKACTYATIRKKVNKTLDTVDNVVTTVTTITIDEVDADDDKAKKVNILQFIKWLQGRNFKMPKGWESRMSAVKADIIDQWKAFDQSKDEHTLKVGQLKRLLQPMVDDMGFIKGEDGNNALKAKSSHARIMLKYANQMTGVVCGETLSAKTWDALLLSVLHSIATDKAFTNTYGTVAVFNEETTEEEKPAETEAETPATEPAAEEGKAE